MKLGLVQVSLKFRGVLRAIFHCAHMLIVACMSESKAPRAL